MKIPAYKEYTVISIKAAADSTLSLEAKGLYYWFYFFYDTAQKISTEKVKEKIKLMGADKPFKELVEKGYIVIAENGDYLV